MAADDVEEHRALLEDPEAWFRMAFDNAPVGMLVASLAPGHEGEIVLVNRALAQLLGTTADALVGRHAPDLSSPDDQPPDRLVIGELVAGTRGSYQREKRMRRADGSDVWVRVTVTLVSTDGSPAFALAHVEDTTDRRSVEDELARRALYDGLTGLPNRVLLVDELTLAVARTTQADGPMAVLYLDLDHFKDVNDTLGHAAGDEVLRQVARRLGDVVVGQSQTIAARLAGDEFVVVSRVVDAASARALAARLHAAISVPMAIGDRAVVARPSIGIALAGSASDAAESLLRRADAAMYHAKHRTREAWALHDATLDALAARRIAVEESLRTALATDGFRLLYQPIVDLNDGRLVAAEALLRLEHPTQGLLAPDAFIDVAEDSDLILPIGEWVMDEATRQLARWQQRRHQLRVAVNVSARQVRHLVLADLVRAAVARSGIDPADLHLEITERVLLEANDDVLAQLRAVAELGCELALDDFGTGYSSLAYLTRFPVTALKIDRSFVAGLGTSGESTAVVEAILGLAEALGLGTVAEGVETAEQRETLREMGCEYAQGYHLGRPMSAAAFSELFG